MSHKALHRRRTRNRLARESRRRNRGEGKPRKRCRVRPVRAYRAPLSEQRKRAELAHQRRVLREHERRQRETERTTTQVETAPLWARVWNWLKELVAK